MSSSACPRCLKPLPESTRRALSQGTKCPYCAAPLKQTTAAEPRKAAALAKEPSKAAPADDGYASFELDGPPPPPAAPHPDPVPQSGRGGNGDGYASFEVSAPAAAPRAKMAPATATAAASPRIFNATMVGGTGVGAREQPFGGAPAASSISLAPPAATPAPASQPRSSAAATARAIAAPAPARTPSARPAVAPAAGRPARTLTPAQALDRPPPTPAPVLKTPAPVAKAPAPVASPMEEADSEPTNVTQPAAPEPATSTLTFPDSEPVIDSVTMTADPEVPPPAAGMLPAPAERRRGLALLGVGMGMAIALLAIVGFKLLRGPGRAAPPIAATLTKTLAPVVEAVKAEAPSEEPQPPAKVATAPAKAEPAPAKAAPARAKATPTPATTLAPEPGRRAPAKPIAEKAPAVSRRRAVTQKEKKANARRGAHARALAMREPAAKKTTAAAPPPERADPRPPYEHGNALLFAGDGKGAIAAYREAVRSAPTDPIGFRGLGLAYEQQGETAQAIKALRRYLKLAPDAPDHDIIARRVDKLSKRPKK